MIWIKEFHLSIIPGRQRPVPKAILKLLPAEPPMAMAAA
eukprot:CAMPEP_0194693758 /NCGR_PEP_ID=MMETSP0295-20121207/20768_1 /TAXON_ID=39354 /ORGANISM="Heterosigma akashiwo, Strain CCMP2393" /LENGTH=38 /DNA_ID= /DNA_START= /DNA_END= /DNA_ORIENTATION=